MRAPLGSSCSLSHSFVVHIGTLFVVLFLSTTTAGIAAPAAKALPAHVEIGLVGRTAEDPTLPQRITSWFDRQRFKVTTHTVQQLDASRILSPLDAETVYIWVTLRTDNNARLYFATIRRSSHDPVYLIRDLQLPKGLDEMGAERIAQVLHLSTVAILEGHIETRREEVELILKADSAANAEQAQGSSAMAANAGRGVQGQTATSTADSAATDLPKGVEFGVGYGISFRGDEGLWHGPRASIVLPLVRSFGFGGLIRTALPHNHEVEGNTLNVAGATFGLFVNWHASVTSSLSLESYAGPGLDIAHHRPTQANDPDLTLAAAGTEARPNLIAGVGAVFGRPFPQVVVTADVTMLPTQIHYDLIDGRSHHSAVHVARLAPSLGVELRF